jgi:Helix-turn-helix domain
MAVTATRLPTPQAASYLSLPVSTLRYYRHIGKGPASYVLGRQVYYDVTDLDDWVAAQKAATVRGGVS